MCLWACFERWLLGTAVGYDVGGRAALHMGALDPTHRLKGIVSVNGFTPMRTDTDASSTGGIRRLWDWHALQVSSFRVVLS